MIELQCVCGERFSVDDQAAGLTADCPRCGKEVCVHIDTKPEHQAQSHPQGQETSHALPDRFFRRRARARREAVLRLAGPTAIDAERFKPAGEIAAEPARNFWADVARSFILPLRPRGLMPLALIVMFYLVFGGLAWLDPGIRLRNRVVYLLIMMLTWWIYGYFLNVIGGTCKGEDDLPSALPDSITCLWDNPGYASLEYWASYVWVWLPMWLAAMASFWFTQELNVLSLSILWGLGMFFWPMTLLTIAVHDMETGASVLRFDHLLRAAMGGMGHYLVICVLAAPARLFEFAFVVNLFGVDHLRLNRASVPTISGAFLALLVVPYVYLNMVGMRAVGLYYRHHKRDLPWTAE
jgi:hypothetical protein